jgi:ferredoxin
MFDADTPELMIRRKALKFGAEFVGFTKDFPNQAPVWARSFILLGAPLILPLLETCPSIWGLEHEKTVKILLEKAVNRVSALLCSLSCRTEKIDAGLTELCEAGHHAGLGTIGENGLLLTEKYGPRAMWASAATSMEFEYGMAMSGDLCRRCGHCRRLCPVCAGRIGDVACAAYEKKLADDFKNPCGVCLRACPVGDDRILFESLDFDKYFGEKTEPGKEPLPPVCKAWAHVRSYGSYMKG